MRILIASAVFGVLFTAAGGSRRAELPVEHSHGSLKFTADTARDQSEATCLYEIVRQDR